MRDSAIDKAHSMTRKEWDDAAVRFVIDTYGEIPGGIDDDGNEKAAPWLLKIGTIVLFGCHLREPAAESSETNPWRYYRNDKWDALPLLNHCCDLSCMAKDPSFWVSAWYIGVQSAAGDPQWTSPDCCLALSATSDYKVYAWRYRVSPEPAPLVEGVAKC